MELSTKEVSKTQALEITIDILMNIKVPMRHKHDIADPVSTAISNLIAIHHMLEDENAAETGPVELQIVKEEPADDQPGDVSETGGQPDPA